MNQTLPYLKAPGRAARFSESRRRAVAAVALLKEHRGEYVVIAEREYRSASDQSAISALAVQFKKRRDLEKFKVETTTAVEADGFVRAYARIVGTRRAPRKIAASAASAEPQQSVSASRGGAGALSDRNLRVLSELLAGKTVVKVTSEPYVGAPVERNRVYGRVGGLARNAANAANRRGYSVTSHTARVGDEIIGVVAVAGS